jgi:RNA polymerase sigma-70 factor (ECF subfamily)
VEFGDTTVAIQAYLGELNGARGDAPAEPIVRELLARAAGRLRVLCVTMLHGGFPRLTRPPLSLDADQMLGAVVERMLKALREARPKDVRQFLALANQHLRWELMDVARRLDAQMPVAELQDGLVPAPESTHSELSGDARRMLEAIEHLPEEEREVFSLVRIQELTQAEAADVIGISTRTVIRRLASALVLLTEELGDLAPSP